VTRPGEGRETAPRGRGESITQRVRSFESAGQSKGGTSEGQAISREKRPLPPIVNTPRSGAGTDPRGSEPVKRSWAEGAASGRAASVAGKALGRMKPKRAPTHRQGLTALRWIRAPRTEQCLEGGLAVRTCGFHGPRRETVPTVPGLGRSRGLVKRHEGHGLRKEMRLCEEEERPEGEIPRALRSEKWVGGGMGSKPSREGPNSEDGRCRVRKARVNRTHSTKSAEGNEIPGEGPSTALTRGRQGRFRYDPEGDRRPREDAGEFSNEPAVAALAGRPEDHPSKGGRGRAGIGKPMSRYCRASNTLKVT
jgi:hypothetical protein